MRRDQNPNENCLFQASASLLIVAQTAEKTSHTKRLLYTFSPEKARLIIQAIHVMRGRVCMRSNISCWLRAWAQGQIALAEQLICTTLGRFNLSVSSCVQWGGQYSQAYVRV